MSPHQRELRKREIEAEKILEEQVLEMIEKINDEKFLVQSFTLEEVIYEITVSGIEVCACNCTDFTYYRTPCKHMYLLLRGFPTFIISRYPSYSNVNFDINISQEEVHNNLDTQQGVQATELASKFERLGELIRTNERSQTLLIKLNNLCTKAFNEFNETSLAPNSHFERQRR